MSICRRARPSETALETGRHFATFPYFTIGDFDDNELFDAVREHLLELDDPVLDDLVYAWSPESAFDNVILDITATLVKMYRHEEA